jgi:hypothetical protein
LLTIPFFINVSKKWIKFQFSINDSYIMLKMSWWFSIGSSCPYMLFDVAGSLLIIGSMATTFNKVYHDLFLPFGISGSSCIFGLSRDLQVHALHHPCFGIFWIALPTSSTRFPRRSSRIPVQGFLL